jgi:hypothetical protein
MQECKPVKVLIPVGVKLSADQCPKTHEEEEDMSRVPYASVVGSLMLQWFVLDRTLHMHWWF